jgi:hypothetical protein
MNTKEHLVRHYTKTQKPTKETKNFVVCHLAHHQNRVVVRAAALATVLQ